MFHNNNLIIIIHNNDLAYFHYLQRVRMIYLDNQFTKCVEISWRYTLSESFRKSVFTKRFNDWIIYYYLTKFHHFMSIYVLSKLRKFNVRRGFLEIFFLPEFQ